MATGEDRKTTPSDADVEAFLDSVADPVRRDDARTVVALFREVTGAEPTMWGDSIIGFGTMGYRTADGREREWLSLGLSPRKAALTLYGLTYYGSNEEVLERLGPHTTGKGCLYVKRLDRLNHEVLRELAERCWATNRAAG